MERKLVTVRRISAIDPIPGADAIEVLTIDGWRVVSKKGEFKVNDLCIFFEIDGFLPEADPRYAFLMKSGVRELEGERGHRLRTVRLRGQLSQGLALPLELFIDDFVGSEFDKGQEIAEFFVPGQELTELLGIKKYDPPIPAALAGQVKGAFPSFAQKTDQERCQNLQDEIFVENAGAEYEVTVKLDGTSVTYYHRDGEVGVCSRNLELKINDENRDNSLVKLGRESLLLEVLRIFGKNVAVQGELLGPAIQGNRENLKAVTYFIFDAQNLDTGEYLTSEERQDLLGRLYDYGVSPALVRHVPVLKPVVIPSPGLTSVDELLAFAEGPSLHHAVREGLVFKRVDGKFSFKAIANAFLLKERD